MAKRALGRGLDSLIPKRAFPEEKKGQIQQIPVSKIKTSPFQPRKSFSSEELQELIHSIRERGVLQPLWVRKRDDHWELIAGERRLRAAVKLGLLTVPALEIKASDVEVLELALIENLQRTDLNPLEEAEGYQRLHEEFQMTQEQIALKVGKDRATVANALRLLKLAPEVRALVASGKISASHARVIAGLGSAQEQKRMADRILNQELSVRGAEKMLQGQKGLSKKIRSSKGTDPNLLKLEQDFRDWLKTKVSIKPRSRHSGTICLEYYSLDDLDRMLAQFRKAGLR